MTADCAVDRLRLAPGWDGWDQKRESRKEHGSKEGASEKGILDTAKNQQGMPPGTAKRIFVPECFSVTARVALLKEDPDLVKPI
jgi:hypothetical protein